MEVLKSQMHWAKDLTSSVVKTSKHLIILIFGETSKHLFIWRFWSVRCFEQNILLPLWWKHLNIWSSDHLDLWETSKHLFIWRLWTIICFEQNILLALGRKHLDIWLSGSLMKHLNIYSSGGFEWSYALNKTS
jgi:hypothetical protein